MFKRVYYRNKETGKEMAHYGSISNGVILTTFEEKRGIPCGNGSAQVFMTTEELKRDWEEFEFKVTLKLDDERVSNLVTFLLKLHSQCNNYGAFEDGRHEFDQIEHETQFMKTLLETDWKNKKEMEERLVRRIDETLPAEVAEEAQFGEGSTFYYLVYDLKEEIKKVFLSDMGDANEE